MSRSLNVGVIGIGFGQQVHVPAFRADPRCQVRAIAARSVERAQAVGQRLGIPHTSGDWRELVASPDIDLISVAVPPALQPLIVVRAAEAGKHVFCEKPPGVDAAGAEAMLAAAERGRVRHAIDFLFPELPAWRRLGELLRSNVLGGLRHAHLTWRTELYVIRHRKESWKLEHDAGGGVLNSFVSHSLYYLEWLFGPIRQLSCRLGPDDRPCETQVDAWLEFQSGLPLSMSVASDAYLGSGHRLEIYGENGTAVLDNPGRDHAAGFRLFVGDRSVDRLEPVAVEDCADRLAPVQRLVTRLVDGVFSGQDVHPGLTEGLRVQRLLDALRAAHRTGRRQTL